MTTLTVETRKANPFARVGGRVVSRLQSREGRYELREIEIDDAVFGRAGRITAAFTRDGHYVGDAETARYLIDELGIAPELARPDAQITSIGYSERDGKWYGWSHRAIHGFGVGDVLEEGNAATLSPWSPEWLGEHPEEDRSLPVGFEVRTRDDARRAAIAFADAVR